MLPDLYRGGEVPRYLGFDEVRKLVDAALLIEWRIVYHGERNQLLLEALWQTGHRVSEIVGGPRQVKGKVVGHYRGLRPCDIDAKEIVLKLQVQKGQASSDSRIQEHMVRIEPSLLTRLVAYYYEQKIDYQGRIFPLTKETVEAIFKRAVDMAGLPSWVHPHTLRHSHAMYLIGQGVPLHIVMEALGHRQVRSTLVYARPTDRHTAEYKANIRMS